MSQHNVTILQKNYNISCSTEEIPRLEECTRKVNELLENIFQSSKAHSETTVMAIALLTLMDELLDYKNKLQNNHPKNDHLAEQNFMPNILHRLEMLNQNITNYL